MKYERVLEYMLGTDEQEFRRLNGLWFLQGMKRIVATK